MSKHLIALAALLGAPAFTPAAEPAKAPAATGDSTTWAFLKTPLPGAATACPDTQPAGSGLVKVPLFAERSLNCPVATAGDETIVLADLGDALVTTHGEHKGPAGKKDVTAIVNRLVDVRLVLQEARAMGVDEMPDAVEARKLIEERVGREILQERVLRDVKPDPKQVEQLFQDEVREWKLQSILFVREAEAKEMAKQLKAGKKFDDLATKAVAEKKAKGNDPGAFVHGSKLIAPVLGAVEKTKAGGWTGPVKVPGGYAMIEVEAVGYPENPAARTQAEQRSLLLQRKEALKKYYEGLLKKYVKIDEKLLKKLDFEAKTPGFEALKKDKRVIATIQGRPSITVGDLAARMEEQFYHGVKNAAEQKRMNKVKGTTLDAIISKPVVALEVEKQGIPATPEYKHRVVEAEDAALFGTFVNKVVVPQVKVGPADVQKYYDAHKGEFTSAAFYKLETIGFAKQKDAEAAVAKLRSGTDFKWLNANAEGKLGEGKDTERPPALLSAKGMTATFAKAMENVKTGDYRVYASPAGQYYAVHVVEMVPPQVQSFDEVKAGLVDKVFGEAVQATLDDYLARLRKVKPVQVYLTRIGS